MALTLQQHTASRSSLARGTTRRANVTRRTNVMRAMVSPSGSPGPSQAQIPTPLTSYDLQPVLVHQASFRGQQHSLPPTTTTTTPTAAAAPSAELSFAMLSTITLGLAGALALALPEASSAQDLQGTHTSLAALQPQFDLAGGEDLLTNMARYGRYFVTVMLGTGYVMLRPLAGAFKNPLTGILATAGLIGGVFLLKFTLELMLGLTDAGDLSFEYVQGNF